MSMTFEQFQQTRVAVHDLGVAVRADGPQGVSGMTYCGNRLFIEDAHTWPGEPLWDGRWYVCIDRSEYRSDDLETVERALYDFAIREGFEA
jgi:hypothetical protein